MPINLNRSSRLSLTLTMGLLALFAITQAHAASATKGKLRIAVLDFSATGTPSPLGDIGAGLQSMLTTDLSQLAAIDVIERQRLSSIRGELKLKGTGLIDTRTAVRGGKLLGASHIVVGTYAVVKGKLRLDGRLVSVQTGKVVEAVSAVGAVDAFFETAKSLGQQLVDALGIRAAPKERAAFATIHTADIGALAAYSRGLSLVDDEQYQEGVDAMRQALDKDENFSLARHTLEDYEQLIEKSKALTRKQKFAYHVRMQEERDKEAREAQQVAQAYLEAAQSDLPPLEKLAALALLFEQVGALTSDRHERTVIEQAVRVQFFELARKRYPKTPLLIPEQPQPYAQVGVSTWRGDTDPKKFARSNIQELAKDWDRVQDMPYRLDHLFDAYGLDMRGRLALAQSIRSLFSQKRKTKWVRMLDEFIAALYRNLLEPDKSTNIHKALGLAGRDKHLENNAFLHSALSSLPQSPVRDEALRFYMTGDTSWVSTPSLDAFKATLSDPSRLERLLEDKRRLAKFSSSSHPLLIIGATPMHPIFHGRVKTGPRPLDFFGSDALVAEPGRFVSGALGRGLPQDAHDVTATFTANPASQGRLCLVAQAFDISNWRDRIDPETGKWSETPMIAIGGCMTGASTVELVRMRIQKNRQYEPDVEVIDAFDVPKAYEGMALRVVRSEKSVEVRAGKKTLSTLLKPDERRPGFWGVIFSKDAHGTVTEIVQN